MTVHEELLVPQDPAQAWLERCALAARARAEQRRQEAWTALGQPKVRASRPERLHQRVTRRRDAWS